MAMSRKHYREVAEIISNEISWDYGLGAEYAAAVKASAFVIANRLATMFQHDNSNFDRDKFLEACGFEK